MTSSPVRIYQTAVQEATTACKKKGDIIYVKSIDRLGRNYSEILDQRKIISRVKHVGIYVIDISIFGTRREKNLL